MKKKTTTIPSKSTVPVWAIGSNVDDFVPINEAQELSEWVVPGDDDVIKGVKRHSWGSAERYDE